MRKLAGAVGVVLLFFILLLSLYDRFTAPWLTETQLFFLLGERWWLWGPCALALGAGFLGRREK